MPGVENKDSSSSIQVSVICTAYNHEKYIRQCLDGFVMQKTTFPFEVLINDDASTDGTAAIIKEYETRYPDIIRPFYQKENLYSQGKFATSYCLVPNARGKYIAFCEGDDFWTDPQKLQIQYDALEDNPDCVFCVHDVDCVTENGREIIGHYPNIDIDEGVISSSEMVQLLCQCYPFQTSSYLFRAEIERSYHQQNPEYKRVAIVGDCPRMLFASQQGNVWYCKKRMSSYRRFSVGSWSAGIVEGGLDARTKQYYHEMKMINAFDKDTKGKYHEFCARSQARSLQRISDLTEDYSAWFFGENRILRHYLSKKEKTYVFIANFAPSVLKAYKGIKRHKIHG